VRGVEFYSGGYFNSDNGNRIQGSGKGNKTVIRIGQTSTDKSQAGYVYSRKGMFVTLIAGTHGYAMGYILRKWQKKSSSLER